jgi:hypothetical protein
LCGKFDACAWLRNTAVFEPELGELATPRRRRAYRLNTNSIEAVDVFLSSGKF